MGALCYRTRTLSVAADVIGTVVPCCIWSDARAGDVCVGDDITGRVCFGEGQAAGDGLDSGPRPLRPGLCPSHYCRGAYTGSLSHLASPEAPQSLLNAVVVSPLAGGQQQQGHL